MLASEWNTELPFSSENEVGTRPFDLFMELPEVDTSDDDIDDFDEDDFDDDFDDDFEEEIEDDEFEDDGDFDLSEFDQQD